MQWIRNSPCEKLSNETSPFKIIIAQHQRNHRHWWRDQEKLKRARANTARDCHWWLRERLATYFPLFATLPVPHENEKLLFSCCCFDGQWTMGVGLDEGERVPALQPITQLVCWATTKPTQLLTFICRMLRFLSWRTKLWGLRSEFRWWLIWMDKYQCNVDRDGTSSSVQCPLPPQSAIRAI